MKALVFVLLSLPTFAGAAEPVVMKVATVAVEGSPWALALGEMKKAIEQAHPGHVKVKLFLGGTLGDENESVTATKRGQVQAFAGSVGAVASLVPELNVLELPYLFENFAEADHAIDTIAAPQLQKAFADRGLKAEIWSDNGYRNFGGKFPVHTLADLKGRKMRSQENPIHLAMWRAFGASPVPIPSTETLTSLQTGVVDGFDQSALVTVAARWHTAARYYSISEHMYQAALVVVNKAFYDALPDAVRKTLDTEAARTVGALRKQVRAMAPQLLDTMKAAGVTVNVVSPAARQEMSRAAERVRADYERNASPGEKDIYRAIAKGLDAFRATQK